jgi:broad specificity phosphatase PhoE
VVSSDLERCRQTAGVLAEALALPVRYDPDLRERSFGVFEGRPWDDVPDGAVGLAGDRVTSPGTRPPGGESVTDLSRRVAGALDRAGRLPGPVLVVTHGGPIRVARGFGTAGRPGWPPVPNAVPIPVCLRGDHPAGAPRVAAPERAAAEGGDHG